MAFIETETGAKLYYSDQGAGRPVVFLHGWAMSGRVWRFQEELSDRFRIILPDQRGHGQSDPADSYAVEAFASDLASLFRNLELRDAVLVGWSMGAQVALQAYPEIRSALAGLVLVGGTPRFTTDQDYPHGKPPLEVKGMGVRLRRDYQKTMGEFFRGMFVEGEMESEQYQRIVHEIVMGGRSPAAEAAAKSLLILSSADLRGRLSSVDRPTLLIHGDGDAICPASASEYMSKRLPRATLKIMKGCGHAPFMTRPEIFNNQLTEFVFGL
jgi:pimeloyl-[acyl-carrier protein] methyl ester esterase